MKQRQFLQVVNESTARARFEEACAHLVPRPEEVRLEEALGRVLAEDVRAPVDVPGFDRSDVDGFAVRSRDTWGAEEFRPVELLIDPRSLPAGRVTLDPGFELAPGRAVEIATGGPLPRGADAVVMVEDTTPGPDGSDVLRVGQAVAPGAHVSHAGSDIGLGETVLRHGERVTSRESGILAAIGRDRVRVHGRPRVGVLSTGDEVRPPGTSLAIGEIHDSNGRILRDALRECGAEPEWLGIVPDDAARLRETLLSAITGRDPPDLVLLSGGTSKGAGDLNHQVVAELAGEVPGSAGILVHGVALKPGKPLCLAGIGRVPVVILPGFPTSAIFTFHEFVAPILRRLAGLGKLSRATVPARVPVRIPSAVGRTEYLLVHLVPGPSGAIAYPMGRGSGSIRTFALADGYVRIDADCEYLEGDQPVDVHPLSDRVQEADLVAIGSHCIGLDAILDRLAALGHRTRCIAAGSEMGLRALARGEADLGGCHLLDPATGIYNRPFLTPGLEILDGYARRQGLVHRAGDPRFEGLDREELGRRVRDATLRMINRNPGSGTRVLIDRLLDGARPPGHENQVSSHHAVAAAVAQGRADWGVTLDVLARTHGLGFIFVQDERYELIVRSDRRDRPALRALSRLLEDPAIWRVLAGLGLVRLDPGAPPGQD